MPKPSRSPKLPRLPKSIADLKVVQWAIEKLLPYARNARTHSDEQVAQVAASIVEFGWTNPILVGEDGVIIAGHARLAAARLLKMEKVPVIVLDRLTPTQRRALVLADNRLALSAGWDEEMLRVELESLDEEGFNLDLVGFTEDELAHLLEDQDGSADGEDEVPEIPETPISIPGDLWLLSSPKGRPAHRVLCGDSTASDAITRLLAGQKPPFIMATDPPYGVSLEPEWREKVGLNPSTRQGGKVLNDDRVDWSAAYSLFPGDVAYVWHAGIHAAEVAVGLDSCEFQIRAQIIWKKQHFAISRGAYHWGHEPCWYAVRKGRTSHWRGDRTQSTVWEVANLNPFGGNSDKENEVTGHGTQKPVELMRRPILNHTQAGEAVYDPFLGSGSSLIAAESTRRVCYGIDIDPKYIDVAVIRWQRFTGRQAVLDGDGRTFDEVAQERRKDVA
jgi:ParB-like chromosome segregation protein Spo0J/DNA modification methylase